MTELRSKVHLLSPGRDRNTRLFTHLLVCFSSAVTLIAGFLRFVWRNQEENNQSSNLFLRLGKSSMLPFKNSEQEDKHRVFFALTFVLQGFDFSLAASVLGHRRPQPPTRGQL